MSIYNSPPKKSADQLHEEYVQETTRILVEGIKEEKKKKKKKKK